MADQLTPGVLVQQPYVISSQLLGNMIEPNQGVEMDFSLVNVLNHLDELKKKVRELEVQFINKNLYVLLHE